MMIPKGDLCLVTYNKEIILIITSKNVIMSLSIGIKHLNFKQFYGWLTTNFCLSFRHSISAIVESALLSDLISYVFVNVVVLFPYKKIEIKSKRQIMCSWMVNSAKRVLITNSPGFISVSIWTVDGNLKKMSCHEK